ncbi:hypothetical protein GJAV_G00057150 [Gymnothorax javanicus]|nr:hypothetical protein GJAV_G00057150 [Gymnothorax javanicus]
MYCQQPVYQYKAVYRPPPVPPSQGDYHVTQLQPYFENGRVQYRYSPYSGSHPPDGPCYEPDPYGTVRFRHGRNPPFPPPLVRAGGKAAGYHYLSRHVLPLGKEHSFISRDMPPSSGPKAGVSYVGWDLDESDRLYMHSLRRESRARQRVKGHTTSLYEDVAILDAGAPEIRHLRSKSDPGKALLMVLSQSHHPVRHPPLDTEPPGYPEQDWRYRGNGPADRQATRHSASRGSQHTPGKLELSHPDLKSEPTDHRHSGRHRKEELPEGRSHPPRYERPDTERHTGRGSVPPGYPEEDPQKFTLKASVPPKSQTTREHLHYPHLPQEGTERGSHLSQRHGKWPGSHYDNLDDYHPAPHQQTTHSRGGAGHFPSSGFTPSHGNRTFSTALGQGAFLPAELSLQRPETEIRAE